MKAISYDDIETLEAERDKLKAENYEMRYFLSRIDTEYRESSGLPVEVQAYFMRSEAKVGLGTQTRESLKNELREIKKQFPNARIILPG